MGIRASSRRVSHWRKVWEGTRTNEGHWDEGSPHPLGTTDQTNRRQAAFSLQTAVIVRVGQSGELSSLDQIRPIVSFPRLGAGFQGADASQSAELNRLPDTSPAVRGHKGGGGRGHRAALCE